MKNKWKNAMGLIVDRFQIPVGVRIWDSTCETASNQELRNSIWDFIRNSTFIWENINEPVREIEPQERS